MQHIYAHFFFNVYKALRSFFKTDNVILTPKALTKHEL